MVKLYIALTNTGIGLPFPAQAEDNALTCPGHIVASKGKAGSKGDEVVGVDHGVEL